jgi:hypothetical protein
MVSVKETSVTRNFASGLIVLAFSFHYERLEWAISKQNRLGAESTIFPE